jgi:D-amino-acid dehydrogenase
LAVRYLGHRHRPSPLTPMLEKESHIAIVGAGIVGLSTACQLTEEGFTVTLIDKGDPATLGPSRGNAGQLAATGIFPLGTPGIWKEALSLWLDPNGPLHIPLRNLPEVAPWLIRFLAASRTAPYKAGVAALAMLNAGANAETEALYTRAGLHNAIRKTGTLTLYESEKAYQADRKKWGARTAHGIEWTKLSTAELTDLEPDLNVAAFAHAFFMPGLWHVDDPYHVACGLYAYAERLGVTLRCAEVDTVLPTENGGDILLANQGRLSADAVILSAGVWTKRLANRLHDTVPLTTERGYNATLTDPGVTMRHPITFTDRGFVLTPLDTGLRIGGQVELGGADRPANLARAENMLRIAKGFLPGLRTKDGPRWMGARPSIPDSLPMIGPSKDSPRILYACGHGHYGLTQSAITGRLLTDHLAQGKALPEAFLPARFG